MINQEILVRSQTDGAYIVRTRGAITLLNLIGRIGCSSSRKSACCDISIILSFIISIEPEVVAAGANNILTISSRGTTTATATTSP